MKILAWASLVLFIPACGDNRSVEGPLDEDPVLDPDDLPEVVVGGEQDVDPLPEELWFKPDGVGYLALGPTHDARFDHSGFLWMGGRYADGATCSSPFGVTTAGVRIGRNWLPNTIHSIQLTEHGNLLAARASFIEKFSNNYFGVQQSWTFPFRPSNPAELVVEVAVAGQQFVTTSPDGLHFAPNGDFGTTYSHATWIDADGVETAIPARFQDGKIVLRVPANVVAASAFPAVLDPQIDQAETPVDNPLTNAPTGAIALAPSVASSGLDYLTVWRDDRNGTDSDIFGLLVTSTGAVGAGSTNGILIGKTAAGARAPGVQNNPTVAFVNGSYLVVWEDTKSPTSDADLVAARVSTAGVVTLLGSIASTAAVERRPRIAVRSSQALVVFESGTGVRAVTYDGASFGAPFDLGAGAQPSVSADPAGDYLVAYSDVAATDLRGQLVTAAGSLNGASFVISAALATQELSATSFAGGNFIVVWQNTSGGRKIFGTRVSPTGTVVDTRVESTLTVGGVQIVGLPAVLQQGIEPALSCGATCTVTWQDRRAFATNGHDVYAQRVGTDLVLAGGEIVISTEGLDQRAPKLALATATNRTLLVWEDLRNGDPSQITAARIDSAGVVLDPPSARVTVSVGANSQVGPAVSRIPGTNQNWLIAWADSRGTTGRNIHGIRVDDNLSRTSLSNAISQAPAAQAAPAVASTATEHFVVWADERNGFADIFGSRVSSTGIVQDLTGIPISTGAADQLRPAIASNGANRYLAVWHDRRGGSFDIYGAILDPSGAVLVADIPISTGANDQFLPSVAYDSVAGQFVVVWHDGRAGVNERDIFAARVSTAGAVLETDFLVNNAAGSQLEPEVAFGTDRFLVVWEDRRNGGSDVMGQRLQITGGVLALDQAEIVISAVAGNQQRPTTRFVSTTEVGPGVSGAFAVVWDDDRTSATTGSDIYGTLVFGASANVVDEFPIAATADSERNATLGPASTLTGGAQRLVVTYHRQNTAINAQRVVMRRVTFAGSTVNCTTPDCTQQCNNGSGTLNCDISCAGANSCTTDCNNASACFVNCQDVGTGDCRTTCNNNSNCDIDCRGATNCVTTCNNSQSCVINCADPSTGDCRRETCQGSTQCILRCVPGDPDCRFGGADGISNGCQNGLTNCDGPLALRGTNPAPAGATQSGTTATFTTTITHGFTVGLAVNVAGVGVAGYNGTNLVITSIPSTTSFTVTLPVSGLGNSGGGSVTRVTPNGVLACRTGCIP